MSYSSHDKEKEQCLLLCIGLNINFPATIVATSFVVLHAWALHLSIIGSHEDAFAICVELEVLQTIKGMGNLHTVGHR